jgi:hypothetical protein
LLLSRAHPGWSFAVLALAIAYKLVPVLLAPVWTVGALPASWPHHGSKKLGWLLPLLVRTAALLAAIGLAFLPGMLYGGSPALDFIRYHQDRGIEVESVYGLVLLFASLCGYPIELFDAYGSYNVRGGLSPLLTVVATGLVVTLLAAGSVWLLLSFLRRPPEATATPCQTLAQVYPRLFISWTFLFLLVAVALSKVLSPQYLLWLLPLAALLPFSVWQRRVILWSFLPLSLLTTLIYPVLFYRHLVGLVPSPDGREILNGPTVTGVALLAVRDLALIALGVFTASLVLRQRPEDHGSASSVLGTTA